MSIMRDHSLNLLLLLAATVCPRGAADSLPVPTPQQLAWQRLDRLDSRRGTNHLGKPFIPSRPCRSP